MKVRDHLPESRNTARHIAREVVLIAIIDTDVRINRPDQDAVDAAIAFFKIFEVVVNGVFARHRIVKETILDHHLRLEEIALRPRELGPRILLAAIAGTNQPLIAPVADVAQPIGKFGWRGRPGNLVALGRITSILSPQGNAEENKAGEPHRRTIIPGGELRRRPALCACGFLR
jgi:hypothetical protein